MQNTLIAISLALAAGLSIAEEKPDEEKWDVNAIRGDGSSVSFTVDEGTWMSVDISPDGKTLVFDLVGDIYTMPAEGGAATRIMGEPSLDIQPRFSPDGQHISFTSDRAGGDNIWVADTDGSNPRQISKESFRLLNNADWSTDGRYLVARKHFTSQRSLGAGEMWMYHLDGGSDGLQLTERKNDQQDAGEPTMGPNGQYLYFSEDVSPGPSFEYNKDPNGSIYAVRRLDLESGELTSLIGGSGSAANPAVAPDNSHIAYVQRIRNQSTLQLFNVQSGATRQLFDNLSHDQQEAWAIFGVYPGMTWTPDSKALIFWAQGKLWRMGINDDASVNIPFTAEIDKTLSAPVRSERRLAEGGFNAQMIRKPALSPDGNWLVFQAAGRLWKQPIGEDEKATRLTRDETIEYQPAFSPDGSRIVYATWNDQARGDVREVSLNGGRSTKLTQRAGIYYEPTYANDGRSVVARRGGGYSLIGSDAGLDTGIFRFTKNQSEKLTDDGDHPHFAGDSQRLYLIEGGGLEKKLVSVNAQGADRREHFELKYPTEIAVSPSGRWVAFVEGFVTYLAPMPKTGRMSTLSAETKSLPIRKLGGLGSRSITWRADSQALAWISGSEVVLMDLSKPLPATVKTEDADKEEDKDGASETDASYDALQKRYAVTAPIKVDYDIGKVAIIGATVLTMKGDIEVENGVVLVEGNRILNVGSADDVAVPSDAQTVDASGKFIIPGLVDVHAHAQHFHRGPTPTSNWAYYANLAYGVTTMHDPSANTETVFEQSEMVRAGNLIGPRVLSTGSILYGADGDIRVTVDNLDDAREHLSRLKEQGAFSVKSYNQPRREQRQQINQAARELDMLVVMEGGSTFFHNLTMIQDGSTGIEHNVPIAPLYEDVVGLWKNTDVRYTPTLVVAYGGPSGENYFYQKQDVWSLQPLSTFMPRERLDSRARRRVLIPEEEYFHVTVAQTAKALAEVGIGVQVGGHGQLQGLAVHWEMQMLQQGGMTPIQALKAGTIAGADYLGLAADIGSIEAGKLADLVILGSDPRNDIAAAEDTTHVMIDGRIYDTATMNQTWPSERKRPAFYWE